MKKIFSLLVGALLVYSCTPKVEELGTPFQAGQQVSLTAHMPGGNTSASQLPGKQRVSGVDAGTHINLTWDAGDIVLVTVDGHTAEFTLESGAGSATGAFTGTMPASGTTYSVQYPVSEPDLSNQTYVESGFGKGLMKMTATDGTIDGGFTLAAQNALFSLQLTGDQALGNIVLTNPANSKTYTLNCSGVTLTSAEQLFYIVVPAETWASGFTVDVYGSDNTTKIKTLTKSSSVNFTAGGAMVMPTQEVKRVGAFSVSATKKVIFSPGNLQYTQSTDTWSFAENQYDCLGSANVDGDVLADKIDLFGWSGFTGVDFGISTSTNNSDYTGGFADWGRNTIGTDAPLTWHTLTKEEWNYLLSSRPNAWSLYGVAQVNGVNGLIVLPDDWSCPVGVTFKKGFDSYGMEYGNKDPGFYAYHQTFTIEEWEKLELAGAVFLPATGHRDGVAVGDTQRSAYYWCATEEYKDTKAPYLLILSTEEGFYSRDKYCGNPVRLVKEYIPELEPDGELTPGIGVFSVSESQTVTFSPGNLQYTQSTNTWSFAENQYDYIGSANLEGDILADKIDLFGWSGYGGTIAFGVGTLGGRYNYCDPSGIFVDWGTNKIGNNPVNAWRTLTAEEWKYLLNTRPNASSRKGVAQVNGVNGLILLPDNYYGSFSSGFHAKKGESYYAAHQTFTEEEWSELELDGAIFLPAAGMRWSTDLFDAQQAGYYWSASGESGIAAFVLEVYSNEASVTQQISYMGHSVRLVRNL